MRDDDESGLPVWVLVVLLAAAALLLGRDCVLEHAKAQTPPAAPVLTDYLVAARVCVKEEGLLPGRGQTVAQHDASFRDGCGCIVATLRAGARRSHRTFVEHVRAYSPHVFDGGGANPWVSELVWGEDMPASWPLERVLWEPHRARLSGMAEWRKARLVAHDAVAGRVASVAPVVPDHWGAPWFTERAIAEHWDMVPCGAALNVFWHVPRRHP